MQRNHSLDQNRPLWTPRSGQEKALRIDTTVVQRALGIAIAGAGALILLDQVVSAAHAALQSSPALRSGVLASLVAGLATGLGALPVLFIRRLAGRVEGLLFALTGGLMLGAAVFGLLLPAIRAAGSEGFFSQVVLGAGLGVVLITGMDRLLPHLHALPEATADDALQRSCWLLVVAIGLHNIPEGLAVGTSFLGHEQFAAANPALGMMTAIGIGVQNLPEGLIVAMALVAAGASRLTGLVVATLTGLFEPVGALLGGSVAGLADAMLPGAMALAAGAMMFVVGHEILPNARRNLPPARIAAGVAAGALVMCLLGMQS